MSRSALDSFAGVLEAIGSRLGGLSVVAATLRDPAGAPLPLTTVTSWRDREAVPPGYWLQIVALARTCGLTSVTIVRMAKIAQANLGARSRAA